jgi:hypothetical protein
VPGPARRRSPISGPTRRHQFAAVIILPSSPNFPCRHEVVHIYSGIGGNVPLRHRTPRASKQESYSALLSSMLHQMAVVQQQPRLGPRRPATPPSPPAARTLQLPCKRTRAGSTEERVADSCCPAELVVVIDDDEDSGCGSCVDGGGRRDDGDAEVSGNAVVWWRQESSRRLCFVSAAGGSMMAEHKRAAAVKGEEEDDAKVAARRREEDRKFWEACLASGYP